MQARHVISTTILPMLAIACQTTGSSPSNAALDSDPCRGARFDADAPDERCLVKAEYLADVNFDALALRFVEDARVRSGATGTFTLELRNVSTSPVVVPVREGCLIWDAVASNETASSFESDCGGLCGSEPKMLRVTLDPGGVLTKRISFTATRTRIVGDACEEQHPGPLLPGKYTLTITLPWTVSDPIPGNAQARSSRTWQTPLQVDPA